MSRLNFFGWGLMTIGFVVYCVGYFITGHPALVDWSFLPGWIAKFVPNLEAEIGLVVMVVAMVPAYWPR